MTFDQWRDTTPVPIGADGALALLVAAVEAETDPSWECNSYHPSLWPALKAARTALASAAQPAAEPAATNDCTCSHPNADMLRAIADGNPVSTASYGKHAMRPNEWLGRKATTERT